MSGTSAGPATDTVPGAADAEVAVAGCNMAVGPVGSSHLHLADHTEAASVAVDTAFLPGLPRSVPAFPSDIAEVLEGHMTALGMDCFAVSVNEGYCPFHTTEVSSLPLDPLGCPGFC